MPMRLCGDCLLKFFALDNRVLRCKPCRLLHRAKTKVDSDRKRKERKRINEMSDIGEAEIDARFAAALKEIRRQSSESLEPFRSYGWLYKEPRS